MTKATIVTDQGLIVGFEIKGHTGFAQRGEDIVCAAISAVSQTALIGLSQVQGLRPRHEIDPDTGLMRVALPKEDVEAAQLTLRILVAGLQSIQQQYPDFFRMTFRERR